MLRAFNLIAPFPWSPARPTSAPRAPSPDTTSKATVGPDVIENEAKCQSVSHPPQPATNPGMQNKPTDPPSRVKNHDSARHRTKQTHQTQTHSAPRPKR